MKRLSLLIPSLALLLGLGLLSAAQAATPLVDANWLADNLDNPRLRVLDLQSPQNFNRFHIPGAVNTDYTQWRQKSASGVSKMLPKVTQLEQMIGKLGIDNDTHVVLAPLGQSASDLAMASRIYWTFKVLGHDEVSILDGGLVGYFADRKRQYASGPAKVESRVFKASLREDWLIDADGVRQVMGDKDVLLVDDRSVAEYLGLHGKKPRGTIPGAKNLPYDWLTDNGTGQLQSPTALANIFAAAEVPTEGRQVLFCQSGHRASLAWFVAHELLGNPQAVLFDGSMNEWGSRKDLPLEQRVKLQ